MLRGLWQRLMRRGDEAAVAREAERERMSPAERRFAEESFEDHQADAFVEQQLGGVEPNRLLDGDEPPRHP
jgi:hypothetical protein